MDEKEYLRLKAKLDLNHQAADQAYKSADAEYQARLKSLNDVWALANEQSSPPLSIGNHADAVNLVRGAWREVARRVIAEIQSDRQFTVKEIQAEIAARNPEVKTDPISILVYLKILVTDGEIKVIRPGRGRKPTVFTKCPVSQVSPEELLVLAD